MKKKKSPALEIWRRFRKNPLALVGLGILAVLFIVTALAWVGVISPEADGHPGYNQQRWGAEYRLQLPSRQYIFGTDNLGRDIFARIAHGGRFSLSVGFAVVTLSMTLGVTLGSIAGFYSGVTDNIIMRFIDILLAIPGILLAVAIVAALGPTLTNIMIAVGVNSVPAYARQMRAQVVTYKDQEFVEAARSVGASDFRILRKHILPNSLAPIIVEASMGMAGAILSVAGLSFIGIGIQAPQPEWGAMLSDGRNFILVEDAWHLTVFPGLAIALIIFSLNLIGDGLRDALDPKLRSGGFSKKRFLKIMSARKEGSYGKA
ncbi:MAG: ABC transporter permease [Defluviitaleaceae bacterium]|nr:ABC transporter permease [Defluviitaleaceae bacterium]